MLFDDQSFSVRREVSIRHPPRADNGWRPPSVFPDLSNATAIGIDVETYEWDWDRGPGWGRGKSHIVGFSLAAEARNGERAAWYFPIRHADGRGSEYNLPAESTLAWLHHELSRTAHIPKVGANLIFDAGSLASEGVHVPGEMHDVQFAEALIDERADTALDVLALKYLGYGKRTSDLYEWSRQAYGGGVDQRSNIYRTSPQLVGPYAEGDALDPLDILRHQWAEMQKQNVLNVYRMEIAAIPMLIGMRTRGVQVNVKEAEILHASLRGDIDVLYEQLTHTTGVKMS